MDVIFSPISSSSEKDTVSWGHLLSVFINDMNPFNQDWNNKGLALLTCVKATSLGFNVFTWTMAT